MARHFAILDEQHRANAAERRNRGAGGSTVRVYATTRAMFAHRDETAGDEARHVARAGWRVARDSAREAFRFALYGDVFEGVEL